MWWWWWPWLHHIKEVFLAQPKKSSEIRLLWLNKNYVMTCYDPNHKLATTMYPTYKKTNNPVRLTTRSNRRFGILLGEDLFCSSIWVELWGLQYLPSFLGLPKQFNYIFCLVWGQQHWLTNVGTSIAICLMPCEGSDAIIATNSDRQSKVEKMHAQRALYYFTFHDFHPWCHTCR